MTKPTRPTVHQPLSAVINADIVRRLREQGVPTGKHPAKLVSAKYWWGFALVFFLLTVAFGGGAAYAVFVKDGATLAIIVALFIPAAFCGVATLYCANQADGEATNAFLTSLVTLGKGAREAVKGDKS